MTNRPSANAILIIGVGNSYRHDDAVGLTVAQQVEEKKLEKVSVIEASGEGATLMEEWKGVEIVFLIDAVQSGAPPGTIHRLDANDQLIPRRFFHYSSHAFSVAEAIELARALGQLPSRLIVYGIEGKNFDAGVGLSSEVEKAACELATRIAQEIHEATTQPRDSD